VQGAAGARGTHRCAAHGLLGEAEHGFLSLKQAKAAAHKFKFFYHTLQGKSFIFCTRPEKALAMAAAATAAVAASDKFVEPTYLLKPYEEKKCGVFSNLFFLLDRPSGAFPTCAHAFILHAHSSQVLSICGARNF
jgi:hypothetical protein